MMEDKKKVKKKKVKKKMNRIGTKGGTTNEAGILFSILIFFGFLSAMSLFLPEPLQFFTAFDFAGLGLGIVGVAGACAIATGIPCGVAIAIYSVYNFVQYYILSDSVLKLVIFLPISIMLIYIIMRIARGGG